MPKSSLKIVAYQRKAYDYAGFTCGNETMDNWLRSAAGQNQRQNRSRTFLLVDAEATVGGIHGYFALVNYHILPGEASLLLGRTHRYPMPATLLTRLAVASSSQGEGLGGLLLASAMRFTLAALEFSASEVFIVDAINDDAARFYQHHGLRLLRDDGQRLFVTTKDIAKTLSEVSLDQLW